MKSIEPKEQWKLARQLVKLELAGKLTMEDWLATPNVVIKRYFKIWNQYHKRKKVES
ncbi:hypothetical protein [Cysteiniphilum halobium]|uniref:hypothetical protein n=1 Tax=Cysteiniphilum halobium TaxID=2219059 RepID=UPI003F86523B